MGQFHHAVWDDPLVLTWYLINIALMIVCIVSWVEWI